jgi:ketosteroid isomerase-like protein
LYPRLQPCERSLDEQVSRLNGNMAWTVGREMTEAKLKDGTSCVRTSLVTDVFEKKDGRWLLVSHHAQPVPQ